MLKVGILGSTGRVGSLLIDDLMDDENATIGSVHVFDELKWRDDETVCPECGELAERVEAMPRSSFNFFTLKELREIDFR